MPQLRHKFTGRDMLLQKIKRGSHFGVLTGMWIFQNITYHRDTNSWKPQTKIRLCVLLRRTQLSIDSENIYLYPPKLRQWTPTLTRRKFTLLRIISASLKKVWKQLDLRHPLSSELSPQSSEPSHCHSDGIHRWLSHLYCVELQLKPSNVWKVQI